jgi:hypothetical protein
MKFNLWTQHGALNSRPVFDAFRTGAMALGHSCSDNTDDNNGVDVIWSVLWHGRMGPNKAIWDKAKEQNKPIIVLEVGGIQRGTTWKVGLNGINNSAFPYAQNNDSSRAEQLGLLLKPWRTEGDCILLCGQHDKSLQWQDMPPVSNWMIQTIDKLQQHSKRKIIVRPHPRCPLINIEKEFKNVERQIPQHINGTYDNFNMYFNNIWATISWSSNPGIQSIVNGVPAIVGPNSIAYDVAEHTLSNIESPSMPNRQQWLNDYAWTEFTIDEIAQGLPLERLTDFL